METELRNYIGLASATHDSALAIVNTDGDVVFAEATERSLRTRRAAHIAPDVPECSYELIRKHCDPRAALILAFSSSKDFPSVIRGASAALFPEVSPDYGQPRLRGADTRMARRLVIAGWYFCLSELRALAARGRTIEYEWMRLRRWPRQYPKRRYFEHHLAHAASACLSSPFHDAVCAIVDGFGEGRASACYAYIDGILRELSDAADPHDSGSLGKLYATVAEACGFDPSGGEASKAMWLAAYGHYDPEIAAILDEMVQVKGLSLRSPSPARSLELIEKLEHLSREPNQPIVEMAHLAATGQKVYEEKLTEYLGSLFRKNISGNLVLGGGCALNCVANGKVLKSSGFQSLHVYSAPGDDGSAMGAALLAFQEDHPHQRRVPKRFSPYLGSSISEASISRLCHYGGLKVHTCVMDAPERAAEYLAGGRVVGWIQGRAEFGPHALGNRSILADARNTDGRDRLTASIEADGSFRQFSPAILHQWGPEYFEDYQESPFMERALRFRNDAMRRVPGAVNVDGVGRLQSVTAESNERLYRLLTAFTRLTGVPVLINTSYSSAGRPIAHTLEDVIAVFFTSAIDAVFVENCLIEK